MKLLATALSSKEIVKGDIFHVEIYENEIILDINTGNTSYSYRFVESNPIRRNKIFDSLASVEGNDFVEIEKRYNSNNRYEIERMRVNLKPVVDIKNSKN